MNKRTTREISVGPIKLGGGNPIVVQSMCATRTTDYDATLKQVLMLKEAGAGFIRVAVDGKKDVDALKSLYEETGANLVVDLQESYRLAKDVAPYVVKLRYNPGHLHHHQKDLSVRDKVKFLADTAGEHECAIRVGVNFGSLSSEAKESADPKIGAVNVALDHCQMLDTFGFENYLVSLKSSDPYAVLEINRLFSKKAPKVPLHIGVTEAGMLPEAELKTRIAFEPLLSEGIGDTLRVSLTLPDNEKWREIEIGNKILKDVQEGRFINPPSSLSGLNVISCPSCSRVENSAFVELAQKVKTLTKAYQDKDLTIAVMGCRVNGPGETDDADIGLWCAPTFVNLKRGPELIGKYKYDEVLGVLESQIQEIVSSR